MSTREHALLDEVSRCSLYLDLSYWISHFDFCTKKCVLFRGIWLCHSAASGPPLSRATAAVAAQWWLSSSAAWQNWQTVGKVFRFNPDPSCFGQNWPAFFIHAPKKHTSNIVNKTAQHLLTNWKSKDTDTTLSSALSNQMRAMTRIPPAIATKTVSWDLITKYHGIEDIHHRTCGQSKKPNIYSVDSTICFVKYLRGFKSRSDNSPWSMAITTR